MEGQAVSIFGRRRFQLFVHPQFGEQVLIPIQGLLRETLTEEHGGMHIIVIFN